MQIYIISEHKHARKKCTAFFPGVSFLQFDRCALDTLKHVRKTIHKTATQTNRAKGAAMLKNN